MTKKKDFPPKLPPHCTEIYAISRCFNCGKVFDYHNSSRQCPSTVDGVETFGPSVFKLADSRGTKLSAPINDPGNIKKAMKPVKTINISFTEMESIISRTICPELNKIRETMETPWDTIICVARGGMFPALRISHLLDIPTIKMVQTSSYDKDNKKVDPYLHPDSEKYLKTLTGPKVDSSRFLVIDELVDSGETLVLIEDYLPRSTFVVMFGKPDGIAHFNSFHKTNDVGPLVVGSKASQQDWLHFPWEIKKK